MAFPRRAWEREVLRKACILPALRRSEQRAKFFRAIVRHPAHATREGIGVVAMARFRYKPSTS